MYAALLDSLYARPPSSSDTLLLADSTLTFEAPTGGVPEWRLEFDAIPLELPAALASESWARRPSEALALPRPVRVLSRAELREIFAPGIRGGWEEFYRRFPAQRRWIALTPVGFSTDSLDAMVYYEYHCGGLCGAGNAVWLSRRDDGRSWRVRKVVQFWIS